MKTLVQLGTKKEIALDSGTQNENEMQIWTQRITDKTNKEVAILRKEMDENLEKILKEMKNNRRTQSVPNRRYQEQNTPRAGTSKYACNEDGEENASEPENQECEIQDNPFRPSNLNELRTPIQPLSMQNISLNDSVVINEDRTQEDYHIWSKQNTTFSATLETGSKTFPNSKHQKAHQVNSVVKHQNSKSSMLLKNTLAS